MSGEDLKVGVRITADATQAKAGVKDAEAAFKDLGVTSASALERAAEEAAQSFAAIRASATASAEDIDAAFAVMAEAELKAASAVGDARAEQVAQALQANAESEAQLSTVTALQQKYVASVRATTDAYKTLGVTSTASLEEAATAARAALQQLRSSGTATSADLRAAFVAVADAELQVAAAAGESQIKLVGAALEEEAATKQQKAAVAALRDEYLAAATGADTAGKSAQGFAQTFVQAAKYTLAYGGVASVFFAIKSALEGMFKTGAQFEVFQQRLTSAFGSAAAGQAVFERLQAVAKTTPLQLTDVVNAAIELKNYGLDPLDGSLKAVIDQSAKLGGGAQTLNSIILALGQAFAKGRLQGQEILQFANAGVPIFDLLSRATGKTSAEILKLSQSGQLGRDAILKLTQVMEQQASGAAAAQMKTLTGIVSNLKDTYSQFLNKVGENGPIQLAKQALSGLSKTFADTGDTAKTTGRTIFQVGESLIGVFDLLKAQFESVKLVFQAVGATFADVLAGITYGISKITFDAISDNFAQTAKELHQRANELDQNSQQTALSIRQAYSDSFTHFAAVADGTYDKLVTGASKAAAANEVAAKKQQADLNDVQNSLKNLGLDYVSVTQGITAKTQQSIDALTSLGRNSQTTAQIMTAAFNAALGKATTKEDAQAIGAAIVSIKVPAFDAASAIAAVKAKVDELPAASASIGQVADAFRTLGIQSSASLQSLADKATAAFRTLTASGTQSAAVLDQAFAKMAAAQLQAAAAAGDAQLQTAAASLRAQASTQQESAALDKLIGKYPQLADAATQTATTQVASANAARTAYDALVASISKADSPEALQQIRNKLTDAYTAGTAGAQEYQAAVTSAYQKEDELAHQATGTAAALANQITYLRNQFVDMGAAATAQFDAIEKSSVVVGESVGAFIDNFNTRLGRLNVYVAQQQDAAKQLTANLSAVGGQTLLNVQLAQSAAQSFKYLDSQTLSNLNNAITSAKQNIDGLRQSADQTLTDLKNQLDQLNGNTLAVEQRANAAKEAAIQQQLQAAQQAGDRQSVGELQQSLQLLQQIGQVQQQQAKAQQTTSTPSAPPATSGRYEITLHINGQSVPVYADTQAQAQQLVAALQAAQSTSTVQ